MDVEDDIAAVVAAVVGLVKIQGKVYPGGQCLHISALTASGSGSGCLPADSEGS